MPPPPPLTLLFRKKEGMLLTEIYQTLFMAFVYDPSALLQFFATPPNLTLAKSYEM